MVRHHNLEQSFRPAVPEPFADPTVLDAISLGAPPWRNSARPPRILEMSRAPGAENINSFLFVDEEAGRPWLNIYGHGVRMSANKNDIYAVRIGDGKLSFRELADMVEKYRASEPLAGVHLLACGAACSGEQGASYAQTLSKALGGFPVKAYDGRLRNTEARAVEMVKCKSIEDRTVGRAVLRSFMPRPVRMHDGRVAAPVRFDGDIVEYQGLDLPRCITSRDRSVVYIGQDALGLIGEL